MTSRPVASVKTQTSTGRTPLKSSQEPKEERIRSHSRNGKQQVTHLEDRTPTLGPQGSPSHSEVAPHKPGHPRSVGQRCQLGTWEQNGRFLAGLMTLLGLISVGQSLAARTSTALRCLTGTGLELPPSPPCA